MLRDYQIKDLAFYFNNPRCGNFSDAGTGKTPSACVYTRAILEEEKRVCWIQPKSIIKKNYDETLKFTDILESDLCIADSKKYNKNSKVIFCTADTFKKRWKEFLPLELVIVDEWHMIYKGNSSQRTRALYDAMKHIPRLLAMTGTMISGRLDSCYPFIHLVNPNYYVNYDNFLLWHGIYDYFGKIIGWKNHERVNKILSRYSIRRSFSEVYGPEKKVIQIEKVDMSPAQQQAYKEFHNKAFLELEDESIIDGSTPGVALIRARQILAHPENVDNKCITKEITGKDERLICHIEDHLQKKTPFIIFSSLVPEQIRIKSILDKYGIKSALINGSTSGENRAKFDKFFREGKLVALVVSPAAAGIGFNWQFCGTTEVDHIIFVSMDYLDITFLQAYRRVMRQQRQTPLRITVLQYRDTVEQKIFEIVKRKSIDANKVDFTREVYDFVIEES